MEQWMNKKKIELKTTTKGIHAHKENKKKISRTNLNNTHTHTDVFAEDEWRKNWEKKIDKCFKYFDMVRAYSLSWNFIFVEIELSKWYTMAQTRIHTRFWGEKHLTIHCET